MPDTPARRRRPALSAGTAATVAAAVVATLASCLTLALVPARAAAFSKAIWGEVTRNGVNQFPLYRELGVSIIELNLNWDEIAPTQPAQPTDPADAAYLWPASIRAAISAAAAYHMRVLLELINAPSWADGGHSGNGWAPMRASTFVAFARAAAREYPSVHLWMIWGEPTKLGVFRPLAPATPGAPLSAAQRASVHLYAEMLDGAYGALKALSRRNLVIGGCTYTTGVIDTQQWIENLRLPDGRPPRMDMYAHNPFSYESPMFSSEPSPFGEVQFSDLHELAGWVDRYLRPGLPLFLSEWTIPTAPDQSFNFWVNPPVAAQWITEALREARAWSRIYALGWVNVYDDLPTSSGGLLTGSGRPKPSFFAFEHG
ncbi:MAG: hypothetical protein ACLP01_04550 [Solirubrobacteraceae bacterium]